MLSIKIRKNISVFYVSGHSRSIVVRGVSSYQGNPYPDLFCFNNNTTYWTNLKPGRFGEEQNAVFFELETPDFALKFVWTIQTKYTIKKVQSTHNSTIF